MHELASEQGGRHQKLSGEAIAELLLVRWLVSGLDQIRMPQLMSQCESRTTGRGISDGKAAILPPKEDARVGEGGIPLNGDDIELASNSS